MMSYQKKYQSFPSRDVVSLCKTTALKYTISGDGMLSKTQKSSDVRLDMMPAKFYSEAQI